MPLLKQLPRHWTQAWYKRGYPGLAKLIADAILAAVDEALEEAEAENVRLKAAVAKFLIANGHGLCHDNRGELAAAFGIEIGREKWPALPPEAEFERRCGEFRQELYGMDQKEKS